METKILIGRRLEEAGIPVNAEILDQLVPMCLQWRHYIDEARRIEVPREEEPGAVDF